MKIRQALKIRKKLFLASSKETIENMRGRCWKKGKLKRIYAGYKRRTLDKSWDLFWVDSGVKYQHLCHRWLISVIKKGNKK